MTRTPAEQGVDVGGAASTAAEGREAQAPALAVGVQLTTRQEARDVDCPRCLARAGSSCSRFDGGLRQAQHLERHTAAIAAGAPVIKTLPHAGRTPAGRRNRP